MNDFTKEELKIIQYCFENISHRKFMEDKSIKPIYLRITSMIDNYCEHELCYIDYDYQPVRCRSCKEVVE